MVCTKTTYCVCYFGKYARSDGFECYILFVKWAYSKQLMTNFHLEDLNHFYPNLQKSIVHHGYMQEEQYFCWFVKSNVLDFWRFYPRTCINSDTKICRKSPHFDIKSRTKSPTVEDIFPNFRELRIFFSHCIWLEWKNVCDFYGKFGCPRLHKLKFCVRPCLPISEFQLKLRKWLYLWSS